MTPTATPGLPRPLPGSWGRLLAAEEGDGGILERKFLLCEIVQEERPGLPSTFSLDLSEQWCSGTRNIPKGMVGPKGEEEGSGGRGGERGLFEE